MNTKKRFLKIAFFMLVLMVLPMTGVATIINPNPASYYNDTGAELFTPSTTAISIELLDPFSGEFGFYRQGDSTTLITIFDSSDTAGDSAFINFIAGWVLDFDANTLQDTFTAGLGNIGFYLKLGAASPIFSEASLNPLSSDWVAAFHSKANPTTYLIGFELPLPTIGLTTIAFEAVGGVSAVPEPQTVMLMLLAIPMLSFFVRRKSGEHI